MWGMTLFKGLLALVGLGLVAYFLYSVLQYHAEEAVVARLKSGGGDGEVATADMSTQRAPPGLFDDDYDSD